jgi:hypothetical protein
MGRKIESIPFSISDSIDSKINNYSEIGLGIINNSDSKINKK